MINEIKRIIENYLNNKKLPAMIVGTVQATGIYVDERFSIPISQVSGTLKGKIRNGDRVRILAGTGWEDFFVLEIVGREMAYKDEIRSEALK